MTLVLLLAGRLVAADPKPGDVGTPEYVKAAELVRDLGHAQYPVREAAARRLVEMGAAAVAALGDGAKSPDAEVRARSAALLPRAKAAGWDRRAAAYLADAKGQPKHDLPLLADWDKRVGPPDAASRKLFAEVVRASGEFLEEVAADRTKAAGVCAARSEALLDQARGPKGPLKVAPGDLAAVLFVDALAPAQLSLSETGPAYLLKNPGLAAALGSAETGPAFRRLLVRWVEAQPANNPVPAIQFADLARTKPFPEAAPVLVKMAKDKTHRWLVQRLLAVEALGAVGGKEAAAALAELVPDPSQMFAGDHWEEYRYGDQALVASLVLHGRKAEGFGLRESRQLFIPPVGKERIPLTVYGFASAEDRAKAVKKWKDEVVEKGGKK